MALSGATAVVGAWGTPSTSNQPRAGAVYVYNDFGVNRPTRSLFDPNDTRQDSFGFAVAVLGRVMLVGGPGEGDSGNGPGAAYLYKGCP